jgi:hypothetical protein
MKLDWKALSEALYSREAAVTAAKLALILSLWGAAQLLQHLYGEKPPPGMGLLEAVRKGQLRPTKRYLALSPAKRRLVRGAQHTLYGLLTILGLLFVLTYLRIL